MYPARRLGRATYRWVAQSIQATQALRLQPERIKPPVMLFQAANDAIVVPAAQTVFCAAAPNCELVPIANARHELFYADDSVRTNLLAQMFAFMRQHSSQPPL